MSLGGGGNPQMQELASRLEELEQQREALEAEIESIEQTKRDTDEAIEALEELETGSTVQVPLGGGAFVRAEIEDIEEVTVDLGADYAAERGREGAIETLEKKKDTLDDRIAELRSDITEVDSQTDQLEAEMEQARAQQMQQLQSQGQPDE